MVVLKKKVSADDLRERYIFKTLNSLVSENSINFYHIIKNFKN